ncbi:MAG: hypothetical protein ACREI8_11170 [Myxococcota bacterium]
MRVAWPLLWLALGCAAGRGEPAEPYLHNRDDYLAFREIYPELLEPNYLPFMVYDVPARSLTRWQRFASWLGVQP